VTFIGFPNVRYHRFDTVVVIKAESQAVLNTHAEQDFQDAFTKLTQAVGMAHMCGRGLLQGPIGPKLLFDKMAAPALEIYISMVPYYFIYEN
jgi:hypothetical protein